MAIAIIKLAPNAGVVIDNYREKNDDMVDTWKSTCPGSGKKPKRIDSGGFGDCGQCSATVRLRKDGKLRSHVRTEDANIILRDLWSLFR